MATTYLEYINESVKFTKDTLESHELLHYIIKDAEIDGSKVEKDKLPARSVYEIATYSALVQVQKDLQELHDKGETRPIKLHDGKEDTLDNLLDRILGKKATKVTKKGGITIIEGTAKNTEDMIDSLEDIIKKIKRGEI